MNLQEIFYTLSIIYMIFMLVLFVGIGIFVIIALRKLLRIQKQISETINTTKRVVAISENTFVGLTVRTVFPLVKKLFGLRKKKDRK